jgi:hypothetical protein
MLLSEVGIVKIILIYVKTPAVKTRGRLINTKTNEKRLNIPGRRLTTYR